MVCRFITVMVVLQLLFTGGWMIKPAWSAEPRITVALVIDAKSHLHDRVLVGLKQSIDERGLSNFYLRPIDINNPDNAEALKATDIDYAIAVGVKPTHFTLKLNPAYPVLYTLVPERTFEVIASQEKPVGAHGHDQDYVIYLGQSASRQLALSEVVTGRKCIVGVVTGEYSSHEAQTLEKVARDRDVDLVVKRASTKDMAIDDFRQVLKQSDVYLALYDTEILNRHNAKWLLYMAYQMNKPVIGFSPSYTHAGAVASIFSTPEQIGQQSAEWVMDMLANRPMAHRSYPKYFTITTNPDIQRNLRLENLSPEQIANLIRRKEREPGND